MNINIIKKCKIDYEEWNNEIIRYNECQNNPNCYFKQFKRKEQECEELKEDIERWKSNFNGKVSAIEELLQQLDQLQKSNEELQTKNEKLKKQVCGLWPELKSIIDKTYSKYNINAKCYHEKIVEIINNLDKYKQALDEIEKYLDIRQKYFDGEDYYNLLDIINKAKGKINEES